MPFEKWRRIILMSLSVVLLFCVTALFFIPKYGAACAEDKMLRVTFLNVGHGDCAILQCEGEALMIDCGDFHAANTIVNQLERLGVREIKYLLVTHAHDDHFGGAEALLKQYMVEVFMHDVEAPEDDFQKILGIADTQAASVLEVHPGDTFMLGEAQISILGPPVSDGDENNSSVVVRVTYGDTSFLFMGDAEYEEEEYIISRYPDIRSDVIKIGHHGANTSTSDELIARVNPSFAVISAEKNRPKYPDDGIVMMLQKKGITTLITGREGHVAMISDGKKIMLRR